MNDINISCLKEGQRNALDILLSGQNVFLTGEAGTGKSTLVKAFIKLAEQSGKEIIITAPTGTAAEGLGGSTIHRAFGADIGVQKNNRALTERKDILKVADIVIIDEISMCRFDLFEYVARRILFENGERAREREQARHKNIKEDEIKENDIQFIVIGDFYQLPPVTTRDDAMELSAVYRFDFGKGYAFKSQLWDVMNFKGVILKEIIRQNGDAVFAEQLTKVRNDNGYEKSRCIDFLMRNSSDFPMVGDDSINLVPTKKKAKEINDIEMAKLDKPEKTYHAETIGDVKDNEKFAEDEIILKEGCKVMTTLNDSSGFYVNGTIGKVISMRGSSIDIYTENDKIATVGMVVKEISKPIVKTDMVKEFVYEPVLDENGSCKTDTYGNVIKKKVLREVEKQTISYEKVGSFKQLPIRVAYAITVHKSQGKTFEKINLDPYAWEPGQFYTALSRGKKLENICFSSTIRPKYIITSPEVKKFMKSIEEVHNVVIDV